MNVFRIFIKFLLEEKSPVSPTKINVLRIQNIHMRVLT